MNNAVNTLEMAKVRFDQDIGVIFGRKQGLELEFLAGNFKYARACWLGLSEADPSRSEPFIRRFLDEGK